MVPTEHTLPVAAMVGAWAVGIAAIVLVGLLGIIAALLFLANAARDEGDS